MALSILSLACAAAVACWDDQQAPLGPPRLEANVQRDTGLAAAGDTYIQQNQANANAGTSTILRVRLDGKNRVLVRWDQATLQQVIGADSLVSARLELTYANPAVNWNQGPKVLLLHRLTQAWTELGATWNCAIDEVPTDGNANCGGGTAWQMTAAPPIVATATASFVVQTGSSGVVPLDVTGDVRAWLAGTATNHGWLLKKEQETASGLAEFGSRESGTPPRLVLSILQADTSVPPIPTTPFVFTYDTTRLIAGTDSTLYQRDVFEVVFKQGTSGAAIGSFFSRFSVTVIGGMQFTQAYVIRVPDPVTKAARDSLLHAMAADANVRSVVNLMYNFRGQVIIHGRWPRDGSSVQRSNWTMAGASDATRGLLQARFPLAWGCETGRYGPTVVDVAVMDFFFQDHADLDQPAKRWLPSFLAQPNSQIAARLATSTFQAHGLAVSGVIGAVADNGAGLAGALWNIRLRQYAFANGNRVMANALHVPDSMIAQAASDGARILVIAHDIEWDLPDPTERVGYLERYSVGFERFLDANPRNIIVHAAGNDTLVAPVATFANGARPGMLSQAIARMFHLGNTHTDRIIQVTAANAAGNALWSGSNDFSGATGTVAAPGEDVRVLWSGNGENTVSGTSVATPLVAGAAALLLAFDPSIGGAEVKRLLTTDTVLNSRGMLVADSVLGRRRSIGSGTLLDAYSPLAMRARAVANLPICGYPVRATDNPDSIVLDAPAPARRAFAFPNGVVGLSVAQGGRQIAVRTRTGAQLDSTVVLSHTGALIGAHIDQWRSFLERDTLIERWRFTFPPGGNGSAFYPEMTVSGPSFPLGPLTIDKFASLVPPNRFFTGTPFVAPSADFVVLGADEFATGLGGPSCQTDTLRWYVAPLNGSGQTLVRTDGASECTGGPVRFLMRSGADWSHDGRVAASFVVNRLPSNAFETRIRRFTPPGSAQSDLAVGSLWLVDPVFSSDDSLVLWTDVTFDIGGGNLTACAQTWRRPFSPYASPFGSTPVSPLGDCPNFLPRRRDNAPPPVAGGPTGAQGFALFRPPPGLDRRRPPIVARVN